MITHPAVADSEFDQYAGDYDGILSQGLAVTGEGKEYFSERRIEWLKNSLVEVGFSSRYIMDFGCGTGSAVSTLLNQLSADKVLGLDPSQKLIEYAQRRYGSPRTIFRDTHDYTPSEEVDLAYCNGVFHHIPVTGRASAARYVWTALRPGGLLALWENNPLNPGTRYIMSRIPFDRDAVTLTSREATELLQAAGFRILRTDFLFIFPRGLSIFRSIEPYLVKYPLGAQYLVLAEKVGRLTQRA